MSKFVRVASKKEIPETGLKVKLNGEEILLIKKDDEVFALMNTCSHQEMELYGGETENDSWICPHHGARFGLRDGKALSMPAVEDIRAFNVKCEGDDILLEEE